MVESCNVSDKTWITMLCGVMMRHYGDIKTVTMLIPLSLSLQPRIQVSTSLYYYIPSF